MRVGWTDPDDDWLNGICKRRGRKKSLSEELWQNSTHIQIQTRKASRFLLFIAFKSPSCFIQILSCFSFLCDLILSINAFALPSCVKRLKKREKNEMDSTSSHSAVRSYSFYFWGQAIPHVLLLLFKRLSIFTLYHFSFHFIFVSSSSFVVEKSVSCSWRKCVKHVKHVSDELITHTLFLVSS